MYHIPLKSRVHHLHIHRPHTMTELGKMLHYERFWTIVAIAATVCALIALAILSGNGAAGHSDFIHPFPYFP